MSKLNEMALVSLAEQMGLAPVEAVALPAAIEVAARKYSLPQARLIWIARLNAEVRACLAEACREAVRS